MGQRRITNGDGVLMAMDVVHHAFEDEITMPYSREELEAQAKAIARRAIAEADAEIEREQRLARWELWLLRAATAVLLLALVYEGFFGGSSGTALR